MKALLHVNYHEGERKLRELFELAYRFGYDGVELRTDLTARLIYQREKKRLYGGANYSAGHSVALFVGGDFHGIDLCYSYEANTEGIGMQSGQHEITLCYRMDLDLGKKGRNRHKSLRYL